MFLSNGELYTLAPEKEKYTATIPIEVIIQDAESPVTPTPESGEETNIVVPDTGAISNDGDSNGRIGSAISIILPIVIIALALSAMIALLVRRQQKRKSNVNANISKKERFATVTSGTIAILAVTVLVGNLVIPATKAATNVEPGTADLDVVDKITITATREQGSDTTIATAQNISYATANLDFGYKVTASMAEGTTTASLYLDGNTDSSYYIAPVVDGTLADNTWGYTLSEPTEESSCLSIPLSTKPTNIVKEVAKTAEDTAVNIYYTVQIDKDMPNGTYTGELEYTIAPAIEYMQDFSTLTSAEKTATLARMTEGKQYTLIDYRGDDKSYYISKLADGNVWMTQNLDLDIDEDTTYTHADTDLGWSDPAHPDLTASWKPKNSTLTVEGTSVPGWSNSNTEPYSADPDDIYYYTSGTDADDTVYASLADCERDHKDGSCPHYHAGNYYNWSAAVASNDASEIVEKYQNAPDSICPAGWRLPTGPQNNTTPVGDGELGTLLATYDVFGDEAYCGSGYYYTESDLNTLRNTPLWLARSGEIQSGGTLNYVGKVGLYPTTTTSGSSIYYLGFYPSSVYPPVNGYVSSKNLGYSMRCVAE